MAEVLLADMGFNYPIILSTYYTGCNWAGAAVFYRETAANPPRFDRRQWTLVILLSLCTSFNTLIGKNNISVPTTFDQVMQAAGPIVVILLVTRIFGRSISSGRKIAVVPIALGVAMTWYADMELSLKNFMVSASCLTFNAMKLVVWSEMLTGDHKVTPLHLLSRVSPMTFVQVGTYAFIRGELMGMVGSWSVILAGWAPYVIIVTGVVSFVLTVMHMHATTFSTPLTVSVLGALKQVVVVLFKVCTDRRPLSRLNVLGMLFVSIGAARYAAVSANERKLRQQMGTTASVSGKKQGTSNSSVGPLLPTTVVPATGSTAVKGKRARKEVKADKGSGGGNAKSWEWRRLWGGGTSDDSRRIR